MLAEDPSRDEAVSYGICPECMEALLGPSRVIMREFLNSIELPVLVTDEQQGIRQANHAAERLLGKPLSRLQAKRIGIAIECIHAGVMGECGESPYCAGCAFRTCIRDTYYDGKPRSGEYSQHKIMTANGLKARRFRYSTAKVGDSVAVAIDGVEDLPVQS